MLNDLEICNTDMQPIDDAVMMMVQNAVVVMDVQVTRAVALIIFMIFRHNLDSLPAVKFLFSLNGSNGFDILFKTYIQRPAVPLTHLSEEDCR